MLLRPLSSVGRCWSHHSPACLQQLSTHSVWARGAHHLLPPSSVRCLSYAITSAARAWQQPQVLSPCSSTSPLSCPPWSITSKRQLHLAPPFLVEDYVPAATTTYRLGRIPPKLEAAKAELADCRICPRNCGVNRLKDELGVCNISDKVVVSTISPHYGEEACLQGWGGSGTVFFSMCNMRCVFCQNWDISQARRGQEMDPSELAEWMLKLQEAGCHNINFVTPEHVAPQVAQAIAAAVEQGLNLPIVYNTSAYDGLATLCLMEGLVDVYMPDFKFWTNEAAYKYAKARDYPDAAKAAILEMHRQVGDLVFSPDGLAKRGLLLRHLVMPGMVSEARSILEWVVEHLGRDTYINIMEQYHPNFAVNKGEQRSRLGWTDYSEIGSRPGEAEVEEVREYARSLGLWRFEEAPRYEALSMEGPPPGLAA